MTVVEIEAWIVIEIAVGIVVQIVIETAIEIVIVTVAETKAGTETETAILSLKQILEVCCEITPEIGAGIEMTNLIDTVTSHFQSFISKKIIDLIALEHSLESILNKLTY